MLILTLSLAILVGLALGLLGGGGSILSLPILVYIGGVSPKTAIPMELCIVGVTSVAALVPHALAGNVRWKTGVTFGAASMIGAYLGGVSASGLSGRTLLALFAGLMIISALAMLGGSRRGSAKGAPTPRHRVSLAPASQRGVPARGASSAKKVALVVLEGFVVGGLTGLVGAGGGFMIVPTLVVLGGLSMRAAVGTSVLIIAMKSFAGAAGHLSHADIPWGLTGAFAAIAVVASIFGARLASRVPSDQLRRAFGYFVLTMGGIMATQELGVLSAVRDRPWLAAAVALGLVLAVARIAREVLPRGPTPSA